MFLVLSESSECVLERSYEVSKDLLATCLICFQFPSARLSAPLLWALLLRVNHPLPLFMYGTYLMQKIRPSDKVIYGGSLKSDRMQGCLISVYVENDRGEAIF